MRPMAGTRRCSRRRYPGPLPWAAQASAVAGAAVADLAARRQIDVVVAGGGGAEDLPAAALANPAVGGDIAALWHPHRSPVGGKATVSYVIEGQDSVMTTSADQGDQLVAGGGAVLCRAGEVADLLYWLSNQALPPIREPPA